MKIKTILVPLDGSQNSIMSLKQALDLADQCGASVIGLHVITDMSAFAAVHPLVIGESKWPSHVKDLMAEARKMAGKIKVPYQEFVIGGKVAGYDIVTFADAKKNAIDLIVMARRGSLLPKEAFPGSTTNFVMHMAKVPVLLVR
ncbi:MAG TPA: universal stress protein [Candidatus Nitrosotalea sp.]|nr:universal stress protein [Candidatus Nitrosotalea sp.]